MSHRTQENRERAEFSEEQASLWRITLGPTIWAVHFAASYALTAVWCAKLADTALDVTPLRWIIGGGTLVALALILWLGWGAWRQWNYLNGGKFVHDEGDSDDRHEFLGHAAFLLCGVSFIGVVYTTLPALILGTCS